jgi:hypothetical protein
MAAIILTEKQLIRIIKKEGLLNNDLKLIEESKWYNIVGDILGIVDPTGIVDIANSISYFAQGDDIFGILSLISAIPYAGDIVAKPVLASLKIGGEATKGLKVAMETAKLGKTAEAAQILTKLSEKPGVVGKFLQSAETWAPKAIKKVDMLPGGLLKGFKNTIIDYLKLFENAGAKSLKFQAEAGKLAKTLGSSVKPLENIKALQSILKDDKILKDLTKVGVMSNIFKGGMPRLFGNRRLRILMRQTKWWLGFLDFAGIGNFVGPDEAAEKLGGEEKMRQMADKYNETPQANQYAKEDFPNVAPPQSSETSTNKPQLSADVNPFQNFFKNIFTSQLGKAAFAAI